MFKPQPVQRLFFTKSFSAAAAAIALHGAIYVSESAKFLGLSITAIAIQLAFPRRLN